jgi:hypothetical protein
MTDDNIVRGSCLCGSISYEARGSILFFNNCHCSMCRKVHGAAYGSFLHTRADGFSWIRGEDQVASFASSAENVRCFCKICGSNVPVVHGEQDHVIIPAGTLDADPGVSPMVHIFTASKAPWHEITDQLPQFPEFPPGH